MSWFLMVAGYLIGCVIGACVAIKADAAWVTNLFSDSVDKTAPDLLTAFCGYGAYGFGMLMLATSYLGFLLIPGVLSVKGFLSGCVFTAGMRGDFGAGFYRAAAELLTPGVFLLPALLVLGKLCMVWSSRLLRCRLGETVPPGQSCSAPLGLVLVCLLLASAAKCYVVPFMLNLF